ncbi:MAG: hypothetical protein IIV58_06705 [Alistipes sp.]|nr:hypothetical protein [Alistipes sp.]
MKQILKIVVAILATVACSYSAQAQTQAQSQTANNAEANGKTLIRTPWGYFDDLVEDAAKYGIKLTLPEGFEKWESGYSRGAGYTCILISEGRQDMLHYHPIRCTERLLVTEENGEKIAIPHGTGRALPKELQSAESVQVYYSTLEKKLTEKQYFSRRECRQLNADEGFVANVPFDRPGWGDLKHNTCIVLKKGHVVLEVSLLTTPEGKAQEQKYLKALYEAIRFE